MKRTRPPTVRGPLVSSARMLGDPIAERDVSDELVHGEHDVWCLVHRMRYGRGGWRSAEDTCTIAQLEEVRVATVMGGDELDAKTEYPILVTQGDLTETCPPA